MTDEEYNEAHSLIFSKYDGYEKWQRDEVYCIARREGKSHGDALAEATGLIKADDLPNVVFESAGKSAEVPEYEVVKDA
jgi:hypothetical protein